MGNNRNIARPNVVLTVTEEGTVEAIGRIKTQINNVADSLYNRLSAVGPSIANATGKSFLTMEQYIDRMLLKINSGLERGSFSAARERMLQDIQVIATALGRLDQQTSAIGLGDISARMNLKAVAADIGMAEAAMAKFKTEAIATQERLSHPAKFTAAQNWLNQRPLGPFINTAHEDAAKRAWQTSNPELIQQRIDSHFQQAAERQADVQERIAAASQAAAMRRARIGMGVHPESVFASQDLSSHADPTWLADTARKAGAQRLLDSMGYKGRLQAWRSSKPERPDYSPSPETTPQDFRARFWHETEGGGIFNLPSMRQKLSHYAKSEFDFHLENLRANKEITLHRTLARDLEPGDKEQAYWSKGAYHMAGKANFPPGPPSPFGPSSSDVAAARRQEKIEHAADIAEWKANNPKVLDLSAAKEARQISMLRRMAREDAQGVTQGSSHELSELATIVNRRAQAHVDAHVDPPTLREKTLSMLRHMAGPDGNSIIPASPGSFVPDLEAQQLGRAIQKRIAMRVRADKANPDTYEEREYDRLRTNAAAGRISSYEAYNSPAQLTAQKIQKIREQGAATYRLNPTPDQYGGNVRSEKANDLLASRHLGFADDGLDAKQAPPSSYNRSHWEMPGQKKSGWRLSGATSNRFRFAAQNVGFGVDDAIQSYQFGGAKASIRAASNNVTAIAGMLIGNPMVAAASVIAISAISAVLPTIMSRFGVKDSLSSITRTARHELRNTDSAGYQEQFYRENYVTNQERFRKSGIAFDAVRAGDSYDALSSSTFGADFSTRTKEIAGQNDHIKRNKMSKENLERDKGLERDRRYQQSQGSSNFNPLNWVMNAGAAAGNYETDQTKGIDKQLDELDKETQDLQDKVHLSRTAIEEGQNKLAANMKMRQNNANEDYQLSLRGGRGEMSLKELQSYHQKRAEQQREVARKELEGDHLQARLHEINYQLAEKLNNPDEDQRKISLSQLHYKESVRSFNRSVSGDSSYTSSSADTAYGIRAKLESQRITGELTSSELARRHAQVDRHFLVQRRRSVEDDLESLNPERNPLKRQSRDLIRKVEDLATRGASKNFTPEEMRRQGIAILTHAEREKNQFDRGQGSRHFITSGYKVGSREDAELEGRVLGNFGPIHNQNKHEHKTFEQILAEIKLLRQTLAIEAKNLGV